VSSARNINHLTCIMPPIGLVSIAAALRAAGHDVRIFDAALDCTVSNERWAARIVGDTPDILGFSTITSNFYDAYDVCEKVKRQNANVKTVFGGVHASWGKETLLKKYEAIDYVVAGEGEYSFCKLAAGEPCSSIEGLYFRNGQMMESGPPHKTLRDMDSLPFPAYDLLTGFPGRYLLPLFGYPRHPGAGIISSRGCVYQCSYCDRSVFGKSFRWNSPEYTVEQIAWLKKDFGVRHVNFYDDQFTTNRARVARLCDLLKKRGLGVSFNCIVRIGHIDADLCRMLKTSGCWMVNAGIESGDQALLDKFKDRLTLEAIRADVNMVFESGMHVKGLFMMGFPGETEASIMKTREFANSLPLKDANVTAFTPFPGAPISSSISEEGTLDDDWSKMDCEHFVFVPKGIPSREFLREQYKLFIKGFYQRPFLRSIYLRMLFQSPHSYWRLIKNIRIFLSYFLKMNKS
jgi:anaerobic magnesium-protoporphyrin IX monomethyl ester cyclase